MDVQDAKSWYVLGNALTGQFFSSSHDPSDLRKALSAYATSAKIPEGSENPDLHFNRGSVHRYLLQFPEAVASFGAAAALDPGLPATAAAEDARRAARALADAVKKRGGVKAKRLARVVEDVRATAVPAGHTAVGVASASASVAGGGERVAMPLRALMPVSRGHDLPLCFVAVDRDGCCVALAVYSANGDVLRTLTARRHVFVALRPEATTVRATGSDGVEHRVPAVVVRDAGDLLVDGRRLTGARAAATLRVDGAGAGTGDASDRG